MITEKMINDAMKTGLSFVCSACEYWHEAQYRDGNVVMCGQKCGGPASGNCFPLYKGPYESMLNHFCFICGKKATAGFEYSGRFLGVCDSIGPGGKSCVDMLKMMLERKSVVVREVVVPLINEK